jgi:hypothetical protein
MISGFCCEVNDNAVRTKNLTKEHQPRNLHVLNRTGQVLPERGKQKTDERNIFQEN